MRCGELFLFRNQYLGRKLLRCLQSAPPLIKHSCSHAFLFAFRQETLYKAWSEIVTNLIPNIRLLETHLNKFCRICDADEVVLFERATFLVISLAGNPIRRSP